MSVVQTQYTGSYALIVALMRRPEIDLNFDDSMLGNISETFGNIRKHCGRRLAILNEIQCVSCWKIPESESMNPVSDWINEFNESTTH